LSADGGGVPVEYEDDLDGPSHPGGFAGTRTLTVAEVDATMSKCVDVDDYDDYRATPGTQPPFIVR